MTKKILIDPSDPANEKFTCAVSGMPNYPFYKAEIGVHGAFSFHRNEAEALMLNIGTSVGLDIRAAVAALDEQEKRSRYVDPEYACLWPESEGWYWAHGRIAGKDKTEVMSAFAVLEGEKIVVYVGRGMTHRLSVPDPEIPLSFVPADLPVF